MTTITLRSKNGDSVYTSEFNSESTILHIKRYLKSQIGNKYPGIGEEKIKIIFKGKTVNDAIPLVTLGDEAVQLVFDVLVSREAAIEPDTEDYDEPKFCRDIITNEISVKVSVRVKETGEKIVVNPEDLVVYNGQVYLVNSRRTTLTLKSVVEILRTIRISKEDIIRFAVFFSLLCTRNGGIVFVLGCVFLLEVLSRKLSSTYHNTFKRLDHFHRSFYMFFISLFIIDHSRF